MLLCLTKNPGRLVSKEELIQAIWQDSFVEESNLAQQIFRIRKAFEPEPGSVNFILTVPGRGYQFTAEVISGRPALLPPADATSDSSRAESGELNGSGFTLEHWRERTHMVVEELVVGGNSFPEPSPTVLTGRKIGFAATILALPALALWTGWQWHQRAAPSQYRQIVLADFTNSTGDATFDRTLKRALEIDLAQSPYMDVLSERTGVSTLQLMGLSRDTPVTADVAREICERTNREVLLTGNLSSLGQRYLLTLEASDCISGKHIANAKAEAATREEVLGALDRSAEAIRKELNESAKSLESYKVPLRDATTSSLEALRAYSIGMYLDSRGERPSSLSAFKRAVELDPKFAMAYRMIGIENTYVGQAGIAGQYFRKAFELSDHVSARELLTIRASYYSLAQRDLIEGVKAHQLLSSTYPQDPAALADEVDGYMTLGQFGPALTLGKRGEKLFSDFPLMFENLATIYRSVNRFDDARNATLRAAQVGKGDTGLHVSLFLIAAAQQDQIAIARENQWFDAHEDGATVWYYPSLRGDVAATSGNLKHAEDLYRNAYEAAKRANLPEAADGILVNQALAEYKLGYSDSARTTLHRIRPSASDLPMAVLLQTELGDAPSAERFLAMHNNSKSDTLMTYVFLPQTRAALALQRGRPADAISALELSRPYQMRDYTVLSLRGEADLNANQPDLAIHEFKTILGNPGIDPSCVLYPLAHLGLARAYALKSNLSESRREYEALFTFWKDADADLPILKEVSLEYAKLSTPTKHPSPYSRVSWR